MLFKKHVIKKLWNFSNLFKILMKNQNLIINYFYITKYVQKKLEKYYLKFKYSYKIIY